MTTRTVYHFVCQTSLSYIVKNVDTGVDKVSCLIVGTTKVTTKTKIKGGFRIYIKYGVINQRRDVKNFTINTIFLLNCVKIFEKRLNLFTSTEDPFV